MTATLYGISTCDTVRKARRWLTAHNIPHAFIDFRATPPTKSQVEHWLLKQGASRLVNKRSTTWKGLSAEERQEAETGDTTAVLLANPTLIKRPILEHADTLDVGFSEQAYAAHFQL